MTSDPNAPLMELRARAGDLAQRLAGELDAGELDRYVELARAPTGPRYTEIPGELLAEEQRCQADSPERAVLRNRALLASLVARFDVAAARCSLPPSVLALYPAHLDRMLKQVERADDALFSLTDDRFLKDVAIVQHRLVPVGAELAQLDSGIPVSFLLRGGPAQWLRALWLVAVRAGGVRPFFELHAHLLALEEFNPLGWERTYVRLGDLLACNPRVRGWMSISWFLDPQLKRISPRLAYLSEVPARGGASLFFVARDEAGESGALAKSASRRERFDGGEYVPHVYMRVWPKRAVRHWCDRQHRVV